MLKQAAASGGSSPVGSPLVVGKLHPSPDRIPRSQSGASIGQSPMKEHVVSSENLLELALPPGEERGDSEGEEAAAGPLPANQHHQEHGKGAGLAQ